MVSAVPPVNLSNGYILGSYQTVISPHGNVYAVAVAPCAAVGATNAFSACRHLAAGFSRTIQGLGQWYRAGHHLDVLGKKGRAHGQSSTGKQVFTSTTAPSDTPPGAHGYRTPRLALISVIADLY